MSRVFIIAEVGVNHDGDLERALVLVRRAAEAGADAVKFQTYKTELLVQAAAAKVEYQRSRSKGETQFQMLKELELSFEDQLVLSQEASRCGIEFMSTPFDFVSLRFLVREIGVRKLKISSGDLTNLPLVHAIGLTGLEVFVSTGMATLGDVQLALGALSHGRGLHAGVPVERPSVDAFAATNVTAHALDVLHKVTVLHCTSEYPTPDSKVNLRALQSLAETFELPVGFSDHSPGTHFSPAAVALGARVIEKHLTLNRDAVGPDHKASLDPESFGLMVRAIRSIESGMGTGVKAPTHAEKINSELVRRGLYAAHDLPSGHVLTQADIAILRPENSTPPGRYWALIGSRIDRDIRAGEDLT